MELDAKGWSFARLSKSILCLGYLMNNDDSKCVLSWQSFRDEIAFINLAGSSYNGKIVYLKFKTLNLKIVRIIRKKKQNERTFDFYFVQMAA